MRKKGFGQYLDCMDQLVSKVQAKIEKSMTFYRSI